MGKIIVLGYNEVKDEEHLLITDLFYSKKRKCRLLMDMYVQHNSITAFNKERIRLVLCVPLEYDKLKDESILYREYELLHKFIARENKDYYLTRYDVAVLKTKIKNKALLTYLLEKIDKLM